MSKICPNCLRPVRSGAYYCGYCGTSLVPTPRDPAPTNNVSTKVSAKAVAKSSGKAKRLPKGGGSGRSWLKVPITLLVLVILAALAIRYWPEILVFLTQALPLIRIS